MSTLSAAGASTTAAASVPSALRLPAIILAGGRQVRVALGAVEGWGPNSSSLIALPHGMEPLACVATLSIHEAPRDAPRLEETGKVSMEEPVAVNAGTSTPEGAPEVPEALLFLICQSGKVLRFQARLQVSHGGQPLSF